MLVYFRPDAHGFYFFVRPNFTKSPALRGDLEEKRTDRFSDRVNLGECLRNKLR